ncbi:ABC transporter permease [Kineosporia rhizophila]|uniref:ABC transporter permease n=1 Tax=Kineosporia TaxID=49184 RepID=UPI000B0F0E0C|nr:MULTISPECIES: ABC transporter permease [Kineosporia]MCE0535938.1 ABC transporter permease [Kineosporia rhizophila]GLY14233.1 glycine/betaine ABC transporter permease [Kineosporia sp. NBRC 101677]
MINGIVEWLSDSQNWSGPDGIPARLAEHLQYSFEALLFVLLIGIPLGLFIGHTGRGAVAVAGTANALRALPTFGLLVYVVIQFSGSLPADWAYRGPALLVLVVLGVPAVLSNTYAGVQNVDAAARDAAKGMGMTGWQVLWRVEVPNALPLILSGVRSSMLQIIATATVAAYVTLGGLGRYIIDGLSQQDYAQMAGGALLVALLAVALDLVFAVVQRYVVSRGITGRYATPAASADVTAAESKVAV